MSLCSTNNLVYDNTNLQINNNNLQNNNNLVFLYQPLKHLTYSSCFKKDVKVSKTFLSKPIFFDFWHTKHYESSTKYYDTIIFYYMSYFTTLYDVTNQCLNWDVFNAFFQDVTKSHSNVTYEEFFWDILSISQVIFVFIFWMKISIFFLIFFLIFLDENIIFFFFNREKLIHVM